MAPRRTRRTGRTGRTGRTDGRYTVTLTVESPDGTKRRGLLLRTDPGRGESQGRTCLRAGQLGRAHRACSRNVGTRVD